VSGPGRLTLDRLADHAEALGVERGYWDVSGQWHQPGPETVLAVLGALGAPVDPVAALGSEAGLAAAVAELGHHVDQLARRRVEPVLVATVAQPLEVELRIDPAQAGATAELTLRSGDDPGGHRHHVALERTELIEAGSTDGHLWQRRRFHLPGDQLGVGYHHLEVELGSQLDRCTVLVAPEHVHQPGPGDRLWGAFAPLYSLRVDHGWGPNVFDLDDLARWLDGLGAKVIGTLPLLAASGPDPSPYVPVSRRFWNEAYLDVSRLDELARSERGRDLLSDPDLRQRSNALRQAPTADTPGQAQLVDRVLAELAPLFFEPGGVAAPGFRAWVDEHPLVVDYARFRAVADRRGTSWQAWPAALRDGQVSADDYDVAVAARHVYAQWSMDGQLAEVARRLGERGQHLYLDLPVGCAPDGFDTWIDRPAYAWGAAVGAPPDSFFAAGQNWGFAPVRPEVGRAEGHRLLAECLRHHMAHAGMLRLDHVMGLQRLYLVPDGMEATAGTYVRYRADEQFAVVAIESSRAGCRVVGEDLGTVPDEVREAMDRHRVLRSYVAEFSLPDHPDQELALPDARMVATVDTHDTLPFAAYLADPDRRAQVRAALARRGWSEAVDSDQSELSELAALLALLAESDAPAVLVSLDDLVAAVEPQNVPGTGPERPNWVLRLPHTLAELAGDPAIHELLTGLQGRRLGSHLRHRQSTAAADPVAAP
jgi:4-alpha-glucanotransferase